MKIVIAFDVDGTIETSSGPVTVERMIQLQDNGVDVWIVSPSGLSPNRRTTNPTNFPESINQMSRAQNLLKVKEQYAKAESNIGGPTGPYLWFYVSDNKDYQAAKDAWFTYIEAAQFV